MGAQQLVGAERVLAWSLLLWHLQCVGPSMLPTLQPRGDVLLHEKASVWMQTVSVGAQRPHLPEGPRRLLPAPAALRLV